jgi:hypothetical protein
MVLRHLQPKEYDFDGFVEDANYHFPEKEDEEAGGRCEKKLCVARAPQAQQLRPRRAARAGWAARAPIAVTLTRLSRQARAADGRDRGQARLQGDAAAALPAGRRRVEAPGSLEGFHLQVFLAAAHPPSEAIAALTDFLDELQRALGPPAKPKARLLSSI